MARVLITSSKMFAVDQILVRSTSLRYFCWSGDGRVVRLAPPPSAAYVRRRLSMEILVPEDASKTAVAVGRGSGGIARRVALTSLRVG